MRLLIFAASILTILLLCITPINAEEIITIPIIEDGYLKERWSVDYIQRKGYLSIGNDNSVYKEGRTRTYIFYSLEPLLSREISPEMINEAKLYLHFYRADRNTPSPNPILINPTDHDPNSFKGTFPDIPAITENTLQDQIRKGYGFRSFDITMIVRSQLGSQDYKQGIYLTSQYEEFTEYFFYASECISTNLYYGPQCSTGMEPRIEISIEDPSPTKATLSEDLIFSNNLDPINLKWIGREEDSFAVEISEDSKFETIIDTSENLTDLVMKFLPSKFGKFYWRVKTLRGSHQPVNSESGEIVLFDTRNFIPEIKLVEDLISNSDQPDIDGFSYDWEYANNLKFNDSGRSNNETIGISDICTGERSIFHVRLRMIDPMGTSSKSSNTITIHCNMILPQMIREKLLASKLPIEAKPPGKEVRGTSTEDEEPKPNYASLGPLKCSKKIFSEHLTCEHGIYQLLGVEHIKIAHDQYWLIIDLQFPQMTILNTESAKCLYTIFLPIECKFGDETDIESHSIFKSAINKAIMAPYIINKGEKGVYRLLYNQAKDYSGKALNIDVYLGLQGHTGLVKTNQIKVIIPDAKKPEYLEKEFIFPFTKPIGVTQWHGQTVFSDPHTGIDFGSRKEEIRAIGDGEVVISQYDKFNGQCLSGGYYMIIKHPSGKHSAYLHLQEGSQRKAPGETVQQGEMIATSGNSGSFNCQPIGYHLHLETRESRLQSTHVDPVSVIEYDWDLVPTLQYVQIPGRLSGDNPHPGK